MSDLSAGAQIGGYELVAPLGRGGMGEVWTARHRRLGGAFALKVIRARDAHGASQTLEERFEREARATAQLTSAHTIRVVDFGAAADGAFYYAMELLDGVDLRTLVERHGPIGAARAAHLLRQACDSLAEAHARGLVHRDVKPANLIAARVGLTVDFLKVLDFGLVKPLGGGDADVALTATGAFTGSPAYMSPELAAGGDIDHRADLYALGCVGHWLLTGALVFPEESAVKMWVAHAEHRPEPPSARADAPIPEAMDALILSCLAKSPGERPASAAAIADALEAMRFDPPWTQARARAWWATHQPDPLIPRPPAAVDGARGGAPTASPGVSTSRRPRPRSGPLEARRDSTMHALEGAFADGDLSMSEYDERLSLAVAARDSDELRVLTEDFDHAKVVAAPDDAPRPRARAGPPALAPSPARSVTAIFSAWSRKGRWQAPARMRVHAIFGAVELDFRRAKLTHDLIEVHCTAVFGGVEVTVPPNVQVEVAGRAFFGAFDSGASREIGGDAPTTILRLTGTAIFGGVSVRVRAAKAPRASRAPKPSKEGPRPELPAP